MYIDLGYYKDILLSDWCCKLLDILLSDWCCEQPEQVTNTEKKTETQNERDILPKRRGAFLSRWITLRRSKLSPHLKSCVRSLPEIRIYMERVHIANSLRLLADQSTKYWRIDRRNQLRQHLFTFRWFI